MSDFDWGGLDQKPTPDDTPAPELRSGGDLVLPLHEMPARVRELLRDPRRPRAVEPKDVARISSFIAEQAYDRDRDGSVGRRAMAAHGWVAVSLLPDGNGFGPGWGEWRRAGEAVYYTGHYWYGVGNGMRAYLANEVEASQQRERVEAATDRDDEALASVPSDGDGLGYAELAGVLGVSDRRARPRIQRLVESGYLREGEVASERGGKPRKVFWRVDRDEAGADDSQGD